MVWISSGFDYILHWLESKLVQVCSLDVFNIAIWTLFFTISYLCVVLMALKRAYASSSEGYDKKRFVSLEYEIWFHNKEKVEISEQGLHISYGQEREIWLMIQSKK